MISFGREMYDTNCYYIITIAVETFSLEADILGVVFHFL